MSPRDRIAKLLTAFTQAEKRAGGRAALPGLPREAQMVEGELYIPGPVGRVHDVADEYMRGKNFGMDKPTKYRPLDKAMAARTAEAFDKLPMYDPAALASYDAMVKETLDQYRAIKRSGLKITPTDEVSYPYVGNPRAVAVDVGDKGHMAFFKTGSGFGSGSDQLHPLLRQSGERIGNYPMTNNDLFRVVHDYFGHIKQGHGFRGAGEDNAWRAHAAMYSPQARPAMTSETRGQNSWLNYGPHGDFNRTANAVDTIYAPQKVGLLPDWVMKYAVPGAVAPLAARGAYDDPLGQNYGVSP